MDLSEFIGLPGEKPLDRILENGGFTGIFRTIGCIGDSGSSGTFELAGADGQTEYRDCMDYSWGSFIERETGSKVFHFSRGGMTAKEYMESFAEQNHFWDRDCLCQAYILALGANDLFWEGHNQPLGSLGDIDFSDFRQNRDTFAGNYAAIIQRLKDMQPKACFFLTTMPHDENGAASNALISAHAELLRGLAERFSFTYVLDLERYAPYYGKDFRRIFFMGGHMKPTGYLLTARMIMSYIDFIIRNHPDDFAEVGLMNNI